MGRRKIITVVGEMNPYGADPRFALYDLPERASGWRLRVLVMQVSRATYRGMHKINLCVGRWGMEQARETASDIPLGLGPAAGAGEWNPETHAPIILLGAKVASAFGFGSSGRVHGPATPFTEVAWPANCAGVRFVLLPHPSGLCRVWNAPDSFERAREVLRRAIPGVPWGEEP